MIHIVDKIIGMVEEGKTSKQIKKEMAKPTKRNWKTDAWRNYKRHAYHIKVNKKFKDCEKCQEK